MAGDFTQFASAQAEDVSGTGVAISKGRHLIEVSGTFGGTTATVQLRRAATSSVAAGPWLSLGSDADFTAAAAQELAVGPGMEIRLVTVGGSSAAVDAFFATIDQPNKS